MSTDNITPTYPCDQCVKVFPTKAALHGHKMVHVAPTPCPECGRDDFKTAIAVARHRTIEHGVTPGYRKTQKVQKPPKIDPTWKVEDIFTAVLGTLFPQGAVPISAIPALLAWREDTQRMLEKVLHD